METFTPCQHEMDAILMRFREGKPDALDKVYNLFASNLLFTARGIIKDEQEAEDIVLDAFHKCWNKRECFESLQKVKCYLYVVIKHACFHYIDKMKSRAKSHKSITFLVEEEEEYVLQRMIKTEMIQRIYGEIGRLPERARNMLTLLYINGLSHTEVSQHLHMPVEHVRVNKSRALNQLKQALAGKAL